MKNVCVVALFILFFTGNCLSVSSAATSAPPAPKIARFTDKHTFVPDEVALVYEKPLYLKYRASFNSLQKTLHRNRHPSPQELEVIFSRLEEPLPVSQEQKKLLDKPESYLIAINQHRVRVMSQEDQGLLNGLSSLEGLLDQYKGKLPQGLILDYPDIDKRVLHLSLWPSTIEDFKASIRLARSGHYNALILFNHFGVNLNSLQHLKVKGLAKWNIAQLREMIVFARENGLEVIPELSLLSNQKKFLQNNFPKFLYNKDTYDPRNKELYNKIVFPAIDELLSLTGATKFHIGHDEVAGWSEYHYRKDIIKTGEQQLPPELFLQDVLILYEYLKKKGVETWMWGDMLLSKEEFPTMKDSGASLNGYNGYAALRPKIPKDIVICDWHYRGRQLDFPTTLTFAEAGHQVLGATWKNQETTTNFSNYIARLPKNGAGMIATTWYGLSGKEKQQVEKIITFSGKAFWNAK